MSINFSPYANNVLDYIDKPMVSSDGRNVKVTRINADFVICVNGEPYQRTRDNIQASSWLNQLECEVVK